MKTLIWIVVLTAAILAGACTPKPVTITTPVGAVAFTADQAAVRVNELMNVAIQANATGALEPPATRIIVTFAMDADTILAKTPDGWRASVKALWAAAKPKITTTNSTVLLAITAADAAIAGLK